MVAKVRIMLHAFIAFGSSVNTSILPLKTVSSDSRLDEIELVIIENESKLSKILRKATKERSRSNALLLW
jgi:hypothetical protein